MRDRPNASYCSLPLLLLPSVLVRFVPPLGSNAGNISGGDLLGSVVVNENCRIVGDSGSVAVGGGEGGRRRS